MKKIIIINLTLLLLTQSQSYLLAPTEPAKVEPPKEHSADKQQPTTTAEKNYENQASPKTPQEPNNNAGTVATKQEPSATTSTKSEASISLESAKNTGEEEGEEEEDPTAVLIDHGGESDVDHAQEEVKKKSEETALKAEEAEKSKKEVSLKAQEAGKSKEKSSEHEEIKTDAADAVENMTQEQADELEASIKKTTQDAKNDPSKSAKISYATSKIMEVASLPTKEESGVYKI